VSEVVTADGVRLHVEIDGSGSPVTVFAHGLTNSCNELAMFTPMLPGTSVRFCFRGHGHSGVPEPGHYRFADFARDVETVADAYAATRAVGTSLGAGAITHILGDRPDRFERIVLLLPAALDLPLETHDDYDRTASRFEGLTREEALDAILTDPARLATYERTPSLREWDALLWQDVNPRGIARAIREVTRDIAIADRELLRRVTAPVLLLCREGDPIHPAELGRVLRDLLPAAELVMLPPEEELAGAIPRLVDRVIAFLTDGSGRP
jgi:pimeloyl-ACP methyl ester carboxylesterase